MLTYLVSSCIHFEGLSSHRYNYQNYRFRKFWDNSLYYFVQEKNISINEFSETPIVLIFITIISSWLLISPIKMIAMKFKSMKLEDNYPKIALLFGAVLILILFKTIGIPLVILYYILISIVFQRQLK